MNKIIQLIPAPAGLQAVAINDCGERVTRPAVAVALTEHGQVEFIYLDGSEPAQTKEARWK